MTLARAEANGCVLDGLARALLDPAANGFEVHYQPIVCLQTRATLAVEALARWRHELAGSIDPEVFVLAAEREGMMAALDDFVLEGACTDAPALTGLLGVHAAIQVQMLARLGCRLGQGNLFGCAEPLQMLRDNWGSEAH